MDIGILALQGSFLRHAKHLEKLDVHYREVLSGADLDGCDGLVIPGGESSTMLKLLREHRMEKKLQTFVTSKPTWGICAGAILLARQVSSPVQPSFDAINISIKRNGYGRQLESHYAEIDGNKVAFIRAPVIERVGEGTVAVGRVEDKPVWVENHNVMVTTFHPELCPRAPSLWHRHFINDFVAKPKWH